MKYIDADRLKAEVKYWRSEWSGYAWEAVNQVLKIIDSLQQEQPEVDLEEELDKFYGIYRKDGKTYDIEDSEECVDWKEDELSAHDDMHIAHYFYELGRKQVLQEIYDGKTKPVDKITAAWLND